ncbi:hypothetical protein [Paraflavitalea sp. CAU 1676]|uniref:hypothetical protein n=1 Tax=Paraflavitalea sp. CAU 1676 TaxID=3032598 RepID=UPI0023DCEB42|nr:hypothetical protein [Paraflavitalea sp. CAU 1676]MDF2188681.1 hypothetical protein [Paraflavitalea sp. CAU 1676]
MSTNNTQENIKDFIEHLRHRLAVDYPTSVILLKTDGAYLAIEFDAELLRDVLDLPLREPTDRIPVPHTVFPVHAFDQYVGVLIHDNISVAVCNLEAPPEGALSPQLTLF